MYVQADTTARVNNDFCRTAQRFKYIGFHYSSESDCSKGVNTCRNDETNDLTSPKSLLLLADVSTLTTLLRIGPSQ